MTLEKILKARWTSSSLEGRPGPSDYNDNDDDYDDDDDNNDNDNDDDDDDDDDDDHESLWQKAGLRPINMSRTCQWLKTLTFAFAQTQMENHFAAIATILLSHATL